MRLFSGNGTPLKDSKKESLKKSKLLLGKSGKICLLFHQILAFDRDIMSGKDSEKEKEESDSLMKKDPWNLSNDSFYDPKHSATSSLAIGLMSAVLQVSLDLTLLSTQASLLNVIDVFANVTFDPVCSCERPGLLLPSLLRFLETRYELKSRVKLRLPSSDQRLCAVTAHNFMF